MTGSRETVSEAMERVKDVADLRAFAESHLTPKGKTFVCPSCGSGEGPNATPAFSIQRDGKRWKCFSCGKSGDVYDLAGIVGNTDDKREQLEIVASWAGVEGLDDGGTKRPTPTPKAPEGPSKPVERAVTKEHEEGRAEVTRYLDECSHRLTKYDPERGDFVWLDREAGAYLDARGVDACKASVAGFGYDPNAGGAKDAEGRWCRRGRVTMPWPVRDVGAAGWPWYYTSRAIDPTAKNGKYHKPSDEKVGHQPDVDVTAMGERVLYVVEGLMDAWAVIFAGDSTGGWPVPLGGVDNAQKVATQIADMGYRGVVVLMCDNDGPGKEASEKMAEILTSKGVRWVEWPWADGEHDPADSWRDTGGPMGGFACTVRAWNEGGAEAAYGERVRGEAADSVASMLTDPEDVLRCIFDGEVLLDPVPTGIEGLDNILGGGLMPGSVTIVGATSSAGKTTLTLQVANTIASRGRVPVLVVTIEQTPTELVAKSIAWVSSYLTGEKSGRGVLTATGMRNSLVRSKWTLEQNRHMVEACNWYAEHIAPRVRYMHGEARPTVEQIERMAELMAVEHGSAPCVFIDYLQLLDCEDGKDVRLATDDNMTALRKMANRLHTPVWVVSSVGRGSYYGTVDLGSYKESGGVEYGCDVALGLQPRDMAEATEAGNTEAKQRSAGKKRETEEREKSLRNVEVTVLKNRYGAVRPRHGVPLLYCCEVDRFIELVP